MLSSFRNKKIEFALKLGIFILLCWAIYKQLILKNDLPDLWSAFELQLNTSFLLLFFTTMVLMLVNWSLEARKWQILLRVLEAQSFSQSLKAIFSGVTLGLFTPNRIGEYGGRLLYIQQGNRIKAAALTAIGSYTQLITTLIAGLVAWPIFAKHLSGGFSYSWYLYGILLLITLIAIILLYHLHMIPRIRIKNKWLSMLVSQIEHLKAFKRSDLSKVMFLSFLRYLVYLIQYILLLKIFGIDIAIYSMMAIVACIFLLQTIIPSITILDFGIRGNIALFVLSQFSINTIGILAAALSIWLINLMIPGLLGYYFIAARKFSKNNETQYLEPVVNHRT